MAAHGLDDAVKLASNESPFGPLPGVLEAVTAATDRAGTYPDHLAERLRRTLAERHDVDPDHVAIGCGSVGMLQQLVLAYAGPGDEVLFPWPSFMAYPQFTLLAGATVVEAPLRDWTADVDALLARVTPRTRAVLIANPNNPTSTALAAGRARAAGRGTSSGRAAGAGRGLPGVRERPRRPGRARHLRPATEPGRAAHVLEGVGPGRVPCRLRRR